jgi:hypothetical protein
MTNQVKSFALRKFAMSLFDLLALKKPLLLGALTLTFVGCGAEQYEQRLRQSKDYFNYLEKIEQNLGPKWSDGRIVDLMRVPKQFQQIPAPVPVKNENGEDELPAVDPRQPDYLNLIFPHEQLVAAWEAPFMVDGADGTAGTRKGYIYVLSNYWMFVGEDPAEALKFLGKMVQLVGDALDNHIPPNKLEAPDVELHPKPGRYLPAQSYSVFSYQPKAITDRDDTTNYTFTMYAKQNGNIQAIVLVVLPDRISSQEKLVERIPMMLESFHITKNEPKPGGQGGTAPAGGSSNPF